MNDTEIAYEIVALIGNISNRPDIREVQSKQRGMIRDALCKARAEGYSKPSTVNHAQSGTQKGCYFCGDDFTDWATHICTTARNNLDNCDHPGPEVFDAYGNAACGVCKRVFYPARAWKAIQDNYPCQDCGAPRTKVEGGTMFTVCDKCWEKRYPPEEEAKSDNVPLVIGRYWPTESDSELALLWTNPWSGKEEKIATFWWPTHPPEATAQVEKWFEEIATRLSRNELQPERPCSPPGCHSDCIHARNGTMTVALPDTQGDKK